MRRVISTGAVVTMLTLAAGAALAGPLQVRTAGTKGQTVTMCPDCKEKVACAKAGDYLVGLAVNLESPKNHNGRVDVHVRTADKKAVTDAKVAVKLSMPKHGHDFELALKPDGHGKYTAATNQIAMAGQWKAQVTVTPATGDAVSQTFTFAK